jgi:hypothetical protein
MTNRRLPAARLLASILLSAAACTSYAAPTPSVAQFLPLLHQQAASESYDQFAVTGLYADEHGRRFGAAILASLAAQPAYRAALQAWLGANPALTQEELVSNWLRRYQQIRLASFDLLEDQDVSILFRLPRLNALYGTPRAGCETRSQKDTYALVHRARQALIEEHKERLAQAIAAAWVRELERGRWPPAGERAPQPQPQLEQAKAMRVAAAFKGLLSTLPAADGAILSNEYAHDKRPPRSPQQECDNVWVASHAIVDASVGDAGLLRQSLAQAAYADAFAQQAPRRATLPARPDFTPGKAIVALPALLEKRKVTGVVSVKVTVDEGGKVAEVATEWHSLAPAYVNSASGDTFASMDVLLPVLEKYYRDGKFTPKVVDGKALPFSFSQEVEWK